MNIIEAKIRLGYIYGHIEIDCQKHGNIKAENHAQLGHKETQLYLGCLYEYGFEYEFNIKKALYWYEQALEHGDDVELKEKIARLNTHTYKYKHF